MRPSYLEPTPQADFREALWKKRLLHEARDPKVRRDPEQRLHIRLARRVLRALGLYRRGVRNVLSASLQDLTFTLPGLPCGFDGFRILHLSDFHFPGPPGFLKALRSLLDGVTCDLCVLTGDYAFNRVTPPGVVRDLLAQVLERVSARQGVVAIPGNNDSSAVIDALSSLPLRMLVNESMRLGNGGDHIYIAGVDDPHEFRCDATEEVLEEIPEGAFVLFLGHSPEAAPLAAGRAGLYLCGHTHGGQICLPGLGPLFLNTRGPRSRAAGTWDLGRMQGYTSRGLGASTIELRYGCRPDAAMITLKCVPGQDPK